MSCKNAAFLLLQQACLHLPGPRCHLGSSRLPGQRAWQSKPTTLLGAQRSCLSHQPGCCGSPGPACHGSYPGDSSWHQGLQCPPTRRGAGRGSSPRNTDTSAMMMVSWPSEKIRSLPTEPLLSSLSGPHISAKNGLKAEIHK